MRSLRAHKETKTNKKITRKVGRNKKKQMANQNCNDWNFQIHWNKLEWVNPRSHIE